MDKEDVKMTFFLNLGFALFEILGGILTGSVLIYSYAIQEFGDAITIAIEYLLEKYSKNKPDNKHTFGYKRFSVIGSFFTSGILVVSSLWILVSSLIRCFKGVQFQLWSVLIFAIIGIVINGYAVFKTSQVLSKNEKKMNLPLLFDALKWIFILVVALIIQVTEWKFLDPLFAIIMALGVGVKSLRTFFSSIQILSLETPPKLDIEKMQEDIKKIKFIQEIKEFHVWSLDGEEFILTMQVLTEKYLNKKIYEEVKNEIKEKSKSYGITHSTIEFDSKEK